MRALIGSLAAVALYRYRFRGKSLLVVCCFVVMMSPDIVMAISLLVLFMLLGISLGFGHYWCRILPFVCLLWWSRSIRDPSGFDVKMLEAARI